MSDKNFPGALIAVNNVCVNFSVCLIAKIVTCVSRDQKMCAYLKNFTCYSCVFYVYPPLSKVKVKIKNRTQPVKMFPDDG